VGWNKKSPILNFIKQKKMHTAKKTYSGTEIQLASSKPNCKNCPDIRIIKKSLLAMKELVLKLSPQQYEKFVAYVFAGSLVIDGGTKDEKTIEGYMSLLSSILAQAKNFEKGHLAFSTPEIPGMYFISKAKEEELLGYFDFS